MSYSLVLRRRLAFADQGVSMTALGKRKEAAAMHLIVSDSVFHGQGLEPMMLHVTAGNQIGMISVAGSTLHSVSVPTAREGIHHTLAPGRRSVMHG